MTEIAKTYQRNPHFLEQLICIKNTRCVHGRSQWVEVNIYVTDAANVYTTAACNTHTQRTSERESATRERHERTRGAPRARDVRGDIIVACVRVRVRV
jgi:hypothetical protein